MNSWTDAPPIVTKGHSGNGLAFFVSERSRMDPNRVRESNLDQRTNGRTHHCTDVSRSIGQGDPGSVLSIHEGQAAATKAAKRIKHSRVVQLKNLLKIGDHPNPMSDLVQERNTRWL